LLFFSGKELGGGDGGNSPYVQFLELSYLSTLVYQPPAEGFLARIALLVIGLCVGFGVFGVFFRHRKPIEKGFGIVSLLLLGLYFIFPDHFAGGTIIQMRMQLYPVFALTLWFAALRWNSRSIQVIGGLFLVFNLVFFATRIGTYRMVGEAVSEILSTAPLIEEESTVLPLYFSHKGVQPNGEKLIRNGLGVFIHSADYLGAEKSLVMLDNYEGAKGYFPINWRPEVNPFDHLGRGISGSEAIPPMIDLKYYIQETKVQVDYVLEWCRGKDWPEGELQPELKADLEQFFELIFVSEFERVRLYRRNY
jgi:hypothetical protein